MINPKSEIRNPKLKLITFLSVITLFSIFYFINSNYAHAEVPVKCEKCSKEDTLKDFSKKETTNTQDIFSEQLKEFQTSFTSLGSLKTQLMNKLINDILGWIQGKSGNGNCTLPGFSGPMQLPCNQTNKPKFVTDWRQYLGDATVEGANAFLEDSNGARFCPSDGGVETTPVIVDLVRKQFNAPFKDQVSCDAPNRQIDVFRPGGGGWDGWMKLNEPGNDFFSAWFLEYEQTAQEALVNQKVKQAEVTNGFLPETRCKDGQTTTKIVIGPDGKETRSTVCINDEIVTPASTVEELNRKAVGSQFDRIASGSDLSSYISTLGSSIFSMISNLGLKNIPPGSVGSGSSVPAGTGGAQSSAELTCAPLLQGTVPGPASVSLIEGFEKERAGQLNGQEGWTAGTQGNDLTVSNTFAHDGSNSLKATGSSSQTGIKNITPIYNHFTLSFWDYWTSIGNSNPDIAFNQASNNASAVDVSAQGNQYRLGSSLLFGNLTLSTWHFIEVEVDLAAHQARARMDSGAWTSWISLNNNNVTQIDQLKVSSGITGQRFIDTISYLTVTTSITKTLPDTAAYQDCINAVQGGQDITAFAKQRLLGKISDELNFLNQILQAKQNTANTLVQSIDTLNQTQSCQTSINQDANTSSYINANTGTQTVFIVPSTLNNDIQARNTIVRQIIALQSRIDLLNSQASAVQAMTNPNDINNAFASYTPSLGPGEGQSNLDSANAELAQVQQNLATDQGKLLNCQNVLSAIKSYNQPTQ